MLNTPDPAAEEYLKSKGWTTSADLYAKIVALYNANNEELDWRKISTLELRDIAKKVGYDYWKCLADSNAIDGVDSYMAIVQHKSKNG